MHCPLQCSRGCLDFKLANSRHWRFFFISLVVMIWYVARGLWSESQKFVVNRICALVLLIWSIICALLGFRFYLTLAFCATLFVAPKRTLHLIMKYMNVASMREWVKIRGHTAYNTHRTQNFRTTREATGRGLYTVYGVRELNTENSLREIIN